MIKYQLESAIIHAATNYLTHRIFMLNNAKEIVKELITELLEVEIAFSAFSPDNKKISKKCR